MVAGLWGVTGWIGFMYYLLMHAVVRTSWTTFTAWLSLTSHVSVGLAQHCLACQGPKHICFWAGVCAAAGEVRLQDEGLLPLQVLQIRLSDALGMCLLCCHCYEQAIQVVLQILRPLCPNRRYLSGCRSGCCSPFVKPVVYAFADAPRCCLRQESNLFG